jgi:hypothetical protein
MQEQDEDLVQIIRELQEARGCGAVFDPRVLSEKVEVVGPSIELSALQSSIYAEIVDRIGVGWDEWYGRLEAFQRREGHCRIPALYRENGLRLGGWVDQQRQNKRTLSGERRQRLDVLGFVWDPNDVDWEVGFGYLKRYKQREGHCRVAQAYKEDDGYGLGKWADHQRQKKESLSEERLRKLNDVGFDWDPLETAWEEGFRRLIAYKDREGHCCVPGSYKEEDGYRFGQWVISQRAKRSTLTPERQRKLDEIGFDWAPREGVWENAFRLLRRYKDREGHCNVPVAHKEDGFGLGQWVINQRARRNVLTAERLRKLDEIGFDWNPFEKEWEGGFRILRVFKEREGHCRVTQDHNEDGFRLGQWVNVQRTGRNALSESRRQRLDEIGFSWNPRDEAWEEALRHLKLYREREGHCSVPVAHKENGVRLGQWVFQQRQTKDRLSEERLRKLNDIGFDWDPLEAAWEDGFRCLIVYKKREGHCRVPVAYKDENGYRLGQWMFRQRQSKPTLSRERRERLDELGFIWDLHNR